MKPILLVLVLFLSGCGFDRRNQLIASWTVSVRRNVSANFPNA